MKTTIAMIAVLCAVVVGLAVADPDPCLKEKIAASKANGSPKTVRALQQCRSRQNTKAPWNRDGAVPDDEYVRVPCPPSLPPWKVCEKKRSEIRDGGT